MSLTRFAIIVAGGSGTRMGADRPKQFLELLGEPVLLHTLRRFADPNLQVQRLIVVLPADQFDIWNHLRLQHEPHILHTVVAGGPTRWASVRNGLEALSEVEEGVVAVHDGVRPLTPVSVIEQCYQVAEASGAAVAAVPVKDSVRQLGPQGSQAVDRSQYQLVQTPQTFRLSLLRQAYQLPEDPLFTDDATVVERLNHRVQLVEGDYRNIKLTTPEDLVIAAALMRNPAPPVASTESPHSAGGNAV